MYIPISEEPPGMAMMTSYWLNGLYRLFRENNNFNNKDNNNGTLNQMVKMTMTLANMAIAPKNTNAKEKKRWQLHMS